MSTSAQWVGDNGPAFSVIVKNTWDSIPSLPAHSATCNTNIRLYFREWIFTKWTLGLSTPASKAEVHAIILLTPLFRSCMLDSLLCWTCGSLLWETGTGVCTLYMERLNDFGHAPERMWLWEFDVFSFSSFLHQCAIISEGNSIILNVTQVESQNFLSCEPSCWVTSSRKTRDLSVWSHAFASVCHWARWKRSIHITLSCSWENNPSKAGIAY